MNAPDPVPKPSGAPEAVASAIVPASVAAKLDESPRWVDSWRSFFRYISTNFNLAGLGASMILAYHAAVAEQALTHDLPKFLGLIVVALAFVGSMYGSLRKQNLPAPPPAHDPTDQAGA